MQFSVCMCVYEGDNPAWFEAAVNSVINQSKAPSEIVLVVDGPVPEPLDAVVASYEQNPLFKIIRLSKNVGLGRALDICLENCSFDVIARMDSDDIALADRFEKQLEFLKLNPDTDIVGGNIAEFVDNIDSVVGNRIVPSAHTDICEYLKRRCPFNHMTVMFKKQSVQKVGGYIDWFWNEDYYLWIRMHLAGMRFANLDKTLVSVRVGADMYKRRGGFKYFVSEAKLQNLMLKNNVIGFGTWLANVLKRFVLQVLCPASLRGLLFKKFARS